MIWFVSFLLLLSVTTPAFANETTSTPKIFIDNKELYTDQPAVVKQERVLVPLRAIFEGLQATVDYNQATKTITGKRGDITVVLTMDSKVAKINEKTITLDVPATAINNRTVVPIRFISEALGDEVNYDAVNKRVLITTKVKDMPVIKNLAVQDVNDYGDGRDLEVSFTRLADESPLQEYRAIVVRASEANNFNLTAANKLPTSNYTVIPKNRANIKQILSSSTRDSSGKLIQNNVAYKVFILAVANNKSYNSSLSAASQTITLAVDVNDIRVSKITVEDIYDYGDGRDIQVSFDPSAKTNLVSEYRIFVVPDANSSSFTLEKAMGLSVNHYESVYSSRNSKVTINLNAKLLDTNGNTIRSNVNYKIFVVSIGTNANGKKNYLADPSTTFKLGDNQITTSVTDLKVTDVNDWGDARDMEISFNRVTDESKISEYRVLVVKSTQANNFNTNIASSIKHYTTIAKTGSNIKQTLSSASRDINGEVIREGVAYTVFVLSLSTSGNIENNTLSEGTSIILTQNAHAAVVTGVTANIVGYSGNASDIEVRFNKLQDETNLLEYRVLVAEAGSYLDVTYANLISPANYTRVNKTGLNPSVRLTADTKDIYGRTIEAAKDYDIYVLSVSAIERENGLSIPTSSSRVRLTNDAVNPAPSVWAAAITNSSGSTEVQVGFAHAKPDTGIAYYEILFVPVGTAFDLEKANQVSSANRLRVYPTANQDVTINNYSARSIRDISGKILELDKSYVAYVLSIADGKQFSTNALSVPSNIFYLTQY